MAILAEVFHLSYWLLAQVETGKASRMKIQCIHVGLDNMKQPRTCPRKKSICSKTMRPMEVSPGAHDGLEGGAACVCDFALLAAADFPVLLPHTYNFRPHLSSETRHCGFVGEPKSYTKLRQKLQGLLDSKYPTNLLTTMLSFFGARGSGVRVATLL